MAEIANPAQTYPIVVLLVDDQPIIAEAVRRMLQNETDITLHYCQDPNKALQMAIAVHPSLILQDLVMPDVDGLMLVKFFRANPQTKDIPLIVLSSKEEPKIKAEAFSMGANDYMVKLPDKIEVLARIRYHSSAYIRLLERNQAYKELADSQQILNAELAEAAEYVRSLLPNPLLEPGLIQTSWRFNPSTKLGGDALGYHWIDEDQFAIYLLDVCGHGVGAAVLSISVMNVLRSQSLPHTDFTDPSEVLSGLNEAFLMERHNNMFFTIWYGIYSKSRREIKYSCGGHPPAVLFTQSESIQLKTPGLVIGGMSGSKFETAVQKVNGPAKLFIFSDGAYEITKRNGALMSYQEFIEILSASAVSAVTDIDRIVKVVEMENGSSTFADDFSILEAIFNG